MEKKLEIVVLDGHTLNSGDLPWKDLGSLGNYVIYDHTPSSSIISRAKNAQIILTSKTILDQNVLTQLPLLQYVGVLATGYDNVDVNAARQQGVMVTNVPHYSTQSVAQLAFSLLLELTHHVGDHSHGVRAGKWTKCKYFSYRDSPLVELAGLTMGIIGYGNIGKAVSSLARAFGMKVLVNTRTPLQTNQDITFVGLEELFKQSDVVSLHCPLSSETQGLITAEKLGLMKDTAFLINTSRGPLIVEEDLAEALNTGSISGAGLDVLSQEPPSPDNPLLTAKNCIITPHIGWATKAARQRLLKVGIENIQNVLSGELQNVVS
jgi:glycerate dehydrogenase